MFTDQFKHEVNSYLTGQAMKLLSHQAVINDSTYRKVSGSLSEAFRQDVRASGMRVDLLYPKHIRFLDMKKTGKGIRKKRYAPIYNKYVYGYLKSDIWKKLNRLIPDQMVKMIEDTIKNVR